ncbi:hypothetical protein M8C21_007538 [Ambrosia artemisiifolia]|uniref:Uncharacterized protein n=1 Tax=Ambrosia artemisiifolia TaxID=4212 RepID=A0AAD5GEC0_AMBAR|nr:hypothetical protein M8C21_007538 [Ambrosia artemisiifolia]
MNVVVRESTMVRPAEETQAKNLWLSSLDLMAPSIHAQQVYFYRPNGAPNFFDTKVMKDALSKALVAFYPLGGRLKQGKDGRIEISCQGQGALFVEAECDGILDDFGDVTHFRCGGVSLVVAFHYYVVDGTSAMHFTNTWSEITRGLEITSPPFMDRTLLRAHDPLQPVFNHIEYHQDQKVNSLGQVPLDETNTVCKMLKVTRKQLNLLKAKSKEDGNTIRYSTFEILASHVWKCVCKSRRLREDVGTKAYILTNGRARLQPPLPPGYFGNVNFITTAIATAGEIQSQPIWYAASKIHDALVTMNNDYLKSPLDYLEQHLDQKPIVSYKYTNIRIVSWGRLCIHDADFGWGRPVFMGPLRVRYEGMCFVLPSAIDDGNLSIIIRLEVEQMKLFSNLFYAIKMFESPM